MKIVYYKRKRRNKRNESQGKLGLKVNPPDAYLALLGNLSPPAHLYPTPPARCLVPLSSPVSGPWFEYCPTPM